jgi:hypothetical protein
MAILYPAFLWRAAGMTAWPEGGSGEASPCEMSLLHLHFTDAQTALALITRLPLNIYILHRNNYLCQHKIPSALPSFTSNSSTALCFTFTSSTTYAPALVTRPPSLLPYHQYLCQRKINISGSSPRARANVTCSLTSSITSQCRRLYLYALYLFASTSTKMCA